MASKNVSLMDFEGNANIGIYMYANDKFCLLGPHINEQKKKEISKSLNVPVYNITILSTNLIGVFLAGNNELLIAPQMQDYEKLELEKICKKHEIKLLILDNILNTYGNNITVSDNKILLSSDYDKNFTDKLKKLTNYEIIKIENENFKAIGATTLFLNSKFFISQDFKEKEVKKIIDEIAGVGSINQGSPYVASGVVGNSFGLIIGSMSTTIEIQNIVESLDYI